MRGSTLQNLAQLRGIEIEKIFFQMEVKQGMGAIYLKPMG